MAATNLSDRRASLASGPHRRRVPSTLIAAVAIGYLIWRAGWTLDSGSVWFSVPLFLLECWAVASLLVTLAVVGHGRRAAAPVVDPAASVPDRHDISVVVDAAAATPEALRRTLVSLREVESHAPLVVVLAGEDPVATATVTRAGGRTRIDPDPNRSAAFVAAAVAEARPFALWVDAGDVITPTTVRCLAEHFVETDLAIVQGSVGLANPDSFLHLREGHDEAAFEREVLAPALGRIGAAAWDGSGSLCRLEAFDDVGDADDRPASRQDALTRLQERGWTTRHEPDAVVRRVAPDTIDDYLRDRQVQASERLRRRALSLRRPNRAGRLALADTHLRSIRQLVAAWLLVVALIAAPAPVGTSVPVWIAIAAAVHGLLAVARHALATGTMGWGDWVRQGWRTVGADISGAGNRRIKTSATSSATGIRALGRLRLATVTLVVIDLAVFARAATLIDADLLPRFATVPRIAVLAVALGCIVSLVDVLQVIARRRQRRADHRIAAALSAIVDEEYCETVDLSPSGAGVVLADARPVGDPISLTLAVPRLDGALVAVDVQGIVRHSRPLLATDDEPLRHLVGVEFGELPVEAWSTLFSYCAIVHPAGIDRVIDPEPIVGPETLDIRTSRLQKAMGPISVAAGVLAAGTMFFGPGAGTAFAAESLGEASACVVSSDGSGRSGAIVQMHDNGKWREIAATDASGCVALAIPRAGSVPVQVTVDGRTKRIDQDLLWDPSVVFETMPVSVEVVSSSGEPVEGARVQWHGGVWREAGATGVDGTVVFETWDQRVPVQVTVDGRTKRIDQNVAFDPIVEFATTEVIVEVASAAGEPVEGARVQWHGGVWREAGATGVDGTVVFETWDQRVPVQVTVDGRTKRIDQNVAFDPIVEFATTEVIVEVASAAGEPVEGARVQWHGGVWREAGATGVDGTVVFETWDQTIPVNVWLDGRVKRIDQNVAFDPIVEFATTEVIVEVASAAGEPVEGARVQWHGGVWREAGATGVDGTVVFETWDQTIPVNVWLDGRVKRIDQNVAFDPIVEFATTEVIVEVASAAGEPVEGARVQWHGGVWREAGATGDDGTVVFETWDQTIPVNVTVNARSQRKDQNTARLPRFRFETVPLPTDVAEDTIEYYNGQWRSYDEGDEFLPGALSLRRADASTHQITLAESEPAPDPEPEPTPLPEPSPEPISEPDSIPEPTPVPATDDNGGSVETEPTAVPAAEPTAAPEPPAPPAVESADVDPPPLVLDLPQDEPGTSARPGGAAIAPPAPVDDGPIPPSLEASSPPAGSSGSPDVAPSAPGVGEDGLIVIVRPIASSADPAADGVVAFDLEVINQSVRRAEAPVVVDVDLGSSLTPTAIDSEPWRCDHAAGRLRCISADPLDPGARSTIAVTARTPEGANASAPTDLAMAVPPAAAVSVTTGDEVGAPGGATAGPVTGASTPVRVVTDGRSGLTTDTLILVALMGLVAIATGVWGGRLRRRKSAA